MMFAELFVPKGTFSQEELRRLAGRLTQRGLLDKAQELAGDQDMLTGAHTDPGVLKFLDSISHVIVHEPAVWIAAGEPVEPAEPRYVVRVHVPNPWRKELTPHLVTSITAILADAERAAGRDAGRLHDRPHAEIHVVGTAEGAYGAFGRVVGESALNDLISQARSVDPDALPSGMAMDPICGMTVPLEKATITLEHEGTTYAFCCEGCRRHFLKRQQAAPA